MKMKLLTGVELFRAGYYSKHQRHYTNDDLAKMIDGVSSVPIGLEFTPSLFDGHLGTATNFIAVQGRIYADLSIAEWLWDLTYYLPEHGFAIAHDKDTMKITGVSIVKNKAFPDDVTVKMSLPPFILPDDK